MKSGFKMAWKKVANSPDAPVQGVLEEGHAMSLISAKN
jgi:hypothetical protein